MEHPVPSPPLPDAETFARVWQRVMPEPDSSPLRLCPPGEISPSRPPLVPLLEGLSAGSSACRKQARCGGSLRPALVSLSAQQRQSFRRLAALHYLRTGSVFCPDPEPNGPVSRPEFLRREYLLCCRLRQYAADLARQETDPCFLRILQDFQGDCRRWAGFFFTFLEQFLPSS